MKSLLQSLTEQGSILTRVNGFLDLLEIEPNYEELKDYLTTYIVLSTLFHSGYTQSLEDFLTSINNAQ